MSAASQTLSGAGTRSGVRARERSGGRSGYLAGPVQDWVFLIAAPLVGIAVYLPFELHPVMQQPFPSGGYFGQTLAHGFISAVIFAHLFLVFFRSHLNREIFRLYPARFVVAPVLLLAAMLTNEWALVALTVLSVWWDVYHSAMQTFGIGRIYDLRQGNDLEVGRRLDRIWNVLFYAGPILGGAALVPHVNIFYEFAAVEATFFTQVPAHAQGHARELTWAVLGFGVPFSVYYVYRYWEFHREGYRVSFQKVALYVILGLVSITCWGFNTFGEAFFVMNFFHALQYFFIVWHTEGSNVTRTFGLERVPLGRYLALALFVAVAASFGVWATGVWTGLRPSSTTFASIIILVSILHFWYDGFIWSVRRGQVR